MRQTLVKRLVDEGIADGDKQARALVMGGSVYVNGRLARAGQTVTAEDSLQLRGLPGKYLAKGGYKLEAAIRAFGLSPEGRVCLDAGASTGGFTDCLLKHGASLVYAVDAGYGQLLGSLRQESRVINMERTNLGDPRLLALDPPPVFGSCDLSYLSLRKAVPLFQAAMRDGGDLICLVKPLFEVEDAAARRSGRLADAAYAPMLTGLIGDLNRLEGAQVLALCESPVTGNSGTREFFLHLRFGQARQEARIDSGRIEEVVSRALALQTYEKAGLVHAG